MKMWYVILQWFCVLRLLQRFRKTLRIIIQVQYIILYYIMLYYNYMLVAIF